MFSAADSEESSELSGGIVRSLINIMQLEEEPQWLEYFIRKLAHFTEYFILGALVFGFFYELLRDKDISPLRNIFASVPVCAVYAASDELHQNFVSGRSPQVKDVCIDTLGALLAAAVIAAVIITVKKKREGNHA